MARKPPVTDPDAPVLTEAELREMRPARAVLTAEEFAAVSSVRRAGRPAAPSPKVPVTIRLDSATVDAFKATGRGWQTRVNAILAEAVKTGRHDG
ncbi:BrnA antitoxin family protein [Methylobacterium sp. J-070]|uniref:BrnA antitoxin family protein n=1 Tax=Methylobacterium sp. J-070 TaxID=2836650 RepID=UPI001FB9AB11|nr:BrnA antitoxin family protein [Methylobacterium sp. J-070]MCJ2048590.1 BrnA antitoxin family protein [Methylobacterium sp. J-070]